MPTIASMILCLLLLASAPAHALTEVRSIATRPGVTLEFLVADSTNTLRKTALIFFTGGNGAAPYRLTESGSIHGWNFLVRSAGDFARLGFTTITVSPPSDHSSGIGTEFRSSRDHGEDIQKLIDYLAGQGVERVFLVGNSRGTLSVASIAAQLRHQLLKGIVLTSTLEYDDFMRLLPLDKITVPVLMVHHRDDACRVASLREALKTRDVLRRTTTVDFVEINGWTLPMSQPCNDMSLHGFFRVEEKVIRVITDWLNGNKVPERLE